VLRHARAIVANSKSLRDAAEKADPFPVTMIPNGVDPKRWYSDADREDSKSFRFLFVGRLQPQKNLGWLLRRMAEVRDISPTLSWNLGIVGDGPQKAEMFRLASELNLGERIHWLGWQDQPNLRSLYANSDLLITPALYEGMPNAVLEAMACGLPVCASAIPSHAELIVHRENGILFPLDEDKTFKTCLLEILTNPGMAKIWGAGAQRRATELFSWEKVVESYLRLLSPKVGP
jgi:glycosyltransferase involved in cell wall biosynthesis